MQSQPSSSQVAMRWARRYWLALVILGLASILVLAGQPVMAADGQPDTNQTVPPPTPRPTSPPPAPTSEPDNDNDDDNDAAPTPAPTTPAADQAAPAPSAGQTTGEGLTAVVQAVTLNVRQGPGTTFPVIGKLPDGTTITVIGRNQAGDWWNICCVPGSQTPGWVSAELVTPDFSSEQVAALPIVEGTAPDAAAPAATPAPVATTTVITPAEGGQPGTVNAVTLNVRGGSSTDTPVIAKLKQDTVVSVLGRNEAGDWLYVCCLAGAQPNGWVSAQFISPTFGTADLEVVTPDASAPAATTPEATTPPAAAEPPAATETVTSTASTSGVSATDTTLEVSIAQQPPFAVQGKEIALVFTVKNSGNTAATDVELQNELPAALSFVSAAAADGGIVTPEEGAAGATVVAITWPSVAAGASTNATVQVRVASDVADGTTFDNLASVTAENAAGATSGITVGMPPSLLPEFW